MLKVSRHPVFIVFIFNGVIEMFIGKWNKAVILTYVGLAFSVVGMALAIGGYDIKYAFICLMLAGICDLFDGAVARMCDRDDEEKAFGVQQDSLVDAISFVAFPITILLSMGFNKIYHIAVYALFAICGVARLGYFNIKTADINKPAKYYSGVPVTYVAMVFPLAYILSFLMPEKYMGPFVFLFVGAKAIFEILNIKIPKPGKTSYALFTILGIAMLAAYVVIP